MKKMFFTVAVFASVLLSSCTKDLLDVPFNTTITKDIVVSAAAGTNPLAQTVTLSIDNADTNKYLNKLKSVEIKKMSYKIVDFTGDSTGKITADLQADGVTLHTASNITVKNEADLATVFEVTGKDVLLKTVAASLMKNKSITLNSAGQAVCTSPMDFKIRVTLELGIVAGAL